MRQKRPRPQGKKFDTAAMSHEQLREFVASPEHQRSAVCLRHPDGRYEVLAAKGNDQIKEASALRGDAKSRSDLVGKGKALLKEADEIVALGGKLASELPSGALVLIAIAHMEANRQVQTGVLVRDDVLIIIAVDHDELHQRCSQAGVRVHRIDRDDADRLPLRFSDLDPDDDNIPEIFTVQTRSVGMSEGTRFRVVGELPADRLN